MSHCGTCHYGCECREHKLSVLIKASLDLASEVDSLKVAAALTLHEKDRIQSIVERAYDACEQLGEKVGISADEPEPCKHVVIVADVCGKCGCEVPA